MNAVQLNFYWRTSDAKRAAVRANAVFIHAKLVAAGVDVRDAKLAVEALFEAGYDEGREDGVDAGYSMNDNHAA